MIAIIRNEKEIDMPFKNPHPLYSVWQGMKRRCYNPNFKHYERYGGKGIKVCDRWLNSFHNFLEDMGPRPEKYTIERIDNNGDYSPNNCRWASRKEQSINRSCTRYVTLEGIEYKVAELAEKSGLKGDTIVKRAAQGLSYAEVICPKRRVYKEAWKKAVAQRVANQIAATHCKNGHEWNEDNTRITPEGWRNCRTCHREKMRRRTAAKKAALG